MSLDGTVQTGRTGGSNDGGPTRATRAVVATVAVAAVALAVLAGAGVAGAASDAGASAAAVQDDSGPDATVTTDEGLSDDDPVVDQSVEQFQLFGEESTDPDYDHSNLGFEWTVEGEHYGELDPDTAQNPTYVVANEDRDGTLTFQLTVTNPDGETDTDSIEVTFEGGEGKFPNADADLVDKPGENSTNRDSGVVELTAFGSDDPDGLDAELSYRWSVDSQAQGELTGAEAYEKDYFAEYEIADADAGETFDIHLTVTDTEGLTATDSITIRVDEDGGGFAPIGFGGPSGSTPDSAPAESSFEISFVSTPSDVEAGDDVEVTLAIENTGDADGTASVDVGIGDAGTETVELDVPAGESRETTVTVPAPEEAGDYDLSVGTQNDQGSYSLSVDDAAVSGGGSNTDDTSSTDESSFGWSSLLGAVFILALVGVAARRFVA